MSREIGRDEWRAMMPPGGDPDPFVTTVREGQVELETEGVGVTVTVTADRLWITVGNAEFAVSGNRITVAQRHPPYPITRWTVLWEGDMVQ